MGEGVEFRIVFSDDATAPAQPSGPPPDSLPGQSGANQSQQAAGSAPQSQPSATPSPLTADQAKQLFEQFGLRPSQVNLPVGQPVQLPPRPIGDDWPMSPIGDDGDSLAGPVRRPRRPRPQPATEPQPFDVNDILPQHSGVASEGPQTPFVEPPPIATGPMAPFKGPTGAVRGPGQPPPPPVEAELVEAGGSAAAKAGGKAAAEAAGAGPSAGLLSKALGAAGKTAVSGAAAEAGAGVAGSAGGAAAGVAGAELLAALGPAAIAVGGFAVVVGAAVIGIKTFVDTLAAEADKIKEFSPDVAFANSQNEVRQILAMQNRAEAIGPQLGQFQNDMGKLNEAASEVWTEILKVLVDIYTTFRPAVEFGSDTLRLIGAEIAMFKAVVESAIPGGEEKAERERLAKATERLAKAFKAFTEDEEFNGKDDLFTLQLQGVLGQLQAMRGGGARRSRGRFPGNHEAGGGFAPARTREPRKRWKTYRGGFGV